MALTLEPTAYDVETYVTLVGSIWPNAIYVGTAVDVIVPFDFQGSEFTLTSETVGIAVNFTIERYQDPDVADESYIPTVIRHTIKNRVESIRLPLGPGVNFITVESSEGNLDKRVGCARYATALYVQALDLNDNVLDRLKRREWSILSPTGSLLVERWFRPYADLLPRTNALHRLAMRAAIDGFRRAGSQRGIENIAAAVTGSNPVFTSILTDSEILDAHTERYRWSEDFAGVDVDVWLGDMCTAAFVAAGIYMGNFPEVWEVQEQGETLLAFQRIDQATAEADRQTRILRNFEGDGGCSVEDLILEQGCFSRIRPWVRLNITNQFIICAVQYPFDTGVLAEYALGAVYWDVGGALNTLIHDPDAVDVEDPTGDGWVGQQLDGRWDYPYGDSFDTMATEAQAFLKDELDCPFEKGFVATPLMTTRTDSQVDETITGTCIFEIFQGAMGPIIQPT